MATPARIFALGLLLLVARAAQAQPHVASGAKIQFDRGQTYFDMGQYDRAIHEFEVGYRLQPLPLFLFDIGNVARVAGLNDKAIEYFKKYLASPAPADAPERAEARRWLLELKPSPAGSRRVAPNAAKKGEVKRMVDEMDAALDAPPPSEPPSPAAVEPNAVPAAAVATTPPARSDRTPVYKQWWLWTTVGVVAVGVGLGVGLGLGLSKPYSYPAPAAGGLGSFRF